VRHGSGIANGTNFNSSGSESADSGLASGTRAADADFHCADAVIARHIGGVRGGLLRGEWRAFTRSSETQRTRAFPGQHVAIRIGDGHDRVVERGLNVDDPEWNVFALLLLERLLLAFFFPVRPCRPLLLVLP
jgi:hypothetical protein